MATPTHQQKVIEKEGPYGETEAVQNFSFQLGRNQRFSKVVVRHGYFVDAIGFSVSGGGAAQGISMYGGGGGNKAEIDFRQGEYITGISGKYGESYISKLKIHTNINTNGYGPYGTNDLDDDFSSTPLARGCHVVGFLGTAEDDHLKSLGLFVEKNSPGPIWVDKKCGPHGSQYPENYSFKLEDGESIKEVIIRHGYIVDAIGFVVAKPNGITYTKKFGGDKGNESKIVLKCGENITQISGTYGNYQHQENICLIATIKIHTNLCPNGYGPYGKGMAIVGGEHNFSSPLLDGPMIGVFGRHCNYLESLGIFYKKME